MDADEILREVVRNILIRSIDRKWQQHLLHIDYLRTEVNLRVVGQKDPLLEFKHEAFVLFDALSETLKSEIAHSLFKFQMMIPEEAPKREVPAVETIRPELDFRTNLSLMPELETHQEG